MFELDTCLEAPSVLPSLPKEGLDPGGDGSGLAAATRRNSKGTGSMGRGGARRRRHSIRIGVCDHDIPRGFWVIPSRGLKLPGCSNSACINVGGPSEEDLQLLPCPHCPGDVLHCSRMCRELHMQAAHSHL